MAGQIVVVRTAVNAPDAYDRRRAVVKIDGTTVALLDPESRQSFEVSTGTHHVSVRLQYNFGAATVSVTVSEGQTAEVVAEKAHAARNAIPPRRYWRLTVL
jgi:hypothetical protein